MRYLAIFLLIFSRSAFADQEFYLGDGTQFQQGSPSLDQKFPEGEKPISAGVYFDSRVGRLSQIVLKITDTEVRLDLSIDKEALSAETKQKFLSGEMVTLTSGRHIQFFRAFGSDARCLLLYSPAGGLLELINLIPKKT